MPVDSPFYPNDTVNYAASGATPDRWIQTGTGTLVAGVLTVNAGISVSPISRIIAMRVTEAGTDGDELRCPLADRTVGGPGVGSITIRAFLNGAPATSDTSTVEFFIFN